MVASMRVYAGIDEAGYGPMFGPFVVARSVFRLDDDIAEASHAPPRSMWTRLSPSVCRSSKDRRRRIAVNDSKKLYTPATGLSRLERGVLAFAPLAGIEASRLDDWLKATAIEGDGHTPDLLWYDDRAGGPTLPQHHTAGELAIDRARLKRCAAAAGVGLAELRAAVVYQDRFNQIIEATRSKGRCAWSFVAKHLWAIWQQHGEHHPWVAVDRQGGRKVYHELLAMIFEGAELRLIDESEDVSRYVLRDGGRSMTVSFETGADADPLPVALASMTAKYTREMLMVRFNRFWQRHARALRATAGYVQDGRRFLAEIETLIDSMGIDRRTLVRSR